MEELSQNKIWAIYETLPNEIKRVFFSVDTANAITNISELNDIDDTIPIVRSVTYVLLGLLPLNLLADTLKEDLKINKDLAKKVAMELEHFIFNSIKPELDKLYNTETKRPEPEIKKDDSYREPIE